MSVLDKSFDVPPEHLERRIIGIGIDGKHLIVEDTSKNKSLIRVSDMISVSIT